MKEVRQDRENKSSLNGVDMSNVPSKLVAQCVDGSGLNAIVESEVRNFFATNGKRLNLGAFTSLDPRLSFHQRLLDILHDYGLNGCLSDFSIRKVDQEVEENFPFLDQFTGQNFNAYILSTRYRSINNGIDGTIYNMFTISSTENGKGLDPKLKLSSYLQFSESVLGFLPSKGKDKLRECKKKFECRN